MNKRAATTLFSLLLAAATAQAQEITLHVDGDDGADVPSGSTPGETWGTAYKYLPDAIARADTLMDDETAETVRIFVAIAANPYRPDQDSATPSNDRTASFDLTRNMSLFGGFTGDTDETNLSDRDSLGNRVTLTGDIGTVGTATDNSRTIVETDTTVPRPDARLDGFIVSDAYDDLASGGGIQTILETLAIINCTIEDNFADVDGGGVMFVDGSQAPQGAVISSVVNCVFRYNEARDGAGAVMQNNHDTIFENCLFHNNEASRDGGALLYQGGAGGPITNCTITDNEADDDAGGVQLACAPGLCDSLDIANTILYGNIDGAGGGEDAQLTLVGFAADCSLNYCDLEGKTGSTGPCGTGGNNIDDDPDFVSSTNYRLQATSPCLEAGGALFAPIDDFDVDDDLDTGGGDKESTPDLDLEPRFSGVIDMGAYEKANADCPADLDDSDDVGFSDLLDVLADWGTCSGACPSDIDDDGTVGFSDLLTVLANWGPCPGETNSGDAFQTALDDAGLDDAEWTILRDDMESGTSSEQENAACWLCHYLDCHDPDESCNQTPSCSGNDPLNGSHKP